MLISIKSEITHLNFEGNEMGDENCKELCLMVAELNTPLVLNRSKCAITDIGGAYLAEMIGN